MRSAGSVQPITSRIRSGSKRGSAQRHWASETPCSFHHLGEECIFQTNHILRLIVRRIASTDRWLIHRVLCWKVDGRTFLRAHQPYVTWMPRAALRCWLLRRYNILSTAPSMTLASAHSKATSYTMMWPRYIFQRKTSTVCRKQSLADIRIETRAQKGRHAKSTAPQTAVYWTIIGISQKFDAKSLWPKNKNVESPFPNQSCLRKIFSTTHSTRKRLGFRGSQIRFAGSVLQRWRIQV